MPATPRAYPLTASVAVTLLLVILVGATFYRTARNYHVPVPKSTARFGLCDFHNAVYFPGKAYANRENPYLKAYAERYPVNREMSPYSPLLLPFAALFGVMPLRVAEVLWCLLNVGATLLLAGWVLKAMGWRRSYVSIVGVGSVLVATRAGHSNLILGQFAAIMAVATCYALHDARRRPLRSAIGLAVACVKPTFGVPLVALMLCQGRLRAAIGGVTISILGAVAVFAWIQEGDGRGLSGSIQQSHDAIVVDEDVDPTSAWMRTDLMALVARRGGFTPDAKAELALMLVLIAPACCLLALRHRQGESQVPDDAPWPNLPDLVVMALIPFSIYHLAYDSLVVAPAIGALLVGKAGLQLAAPARWVGLIALALPTINYLTTWSVMQRLGLEGAALGLVLDLTPVSLMVAVAILTAALARRPATLAPPPSPR